VHGQEAGENRFGRRSTASINRAMVIASWSAFWVRRFGAQP
jgi:hypothetical protein